MPPPQRQQSVVQSRRCTTSSHKTSGTSTASSNAAPAGLFNGHQTRNLKMKIRPVKHEGMFPKNRYCGPAAISIISGISTGEAAKLLRYITGARAIRGVWTWDLEIALNDLGYELLAHHSPRHDSVPRKERPTLARWLKDTKATHQRARFSNRCGQSLRCQWQALLLR